MKRAYILSQINGMYPEYINHIFVYFSLIQFFKLMKKWSDMANLPPDLRSKVDRIERNFAVSTVIFKKFEPIYNDIFKNPATDRARPPRGRKQK